MPSVARPAPHAAQVKYQMKITVVNARPEVICPTVPASSNCADVGSIESPSWSPDGRRVAFVSYQMLP